MRVLSLSLICVLVGACGDDSAPPPTPRDGGPRDSGTFDGAVPDGGEPDGDVDGGDDDGGAPDGGGVDGGRDGGIVDIPDAPDGPSGCFDDAGVFDLCRCSVPTCDPSGSACPGRLRCVADGCGRHTCQPAGQQCVTAGDCPSGSDCVTARGYDGAPTDVCWRSGGCADSRDCPLGFSCDSGACVDRRVPCDEELPCPFGFFCNDGDAYARPYCARVSRRCETFFGSCPPFFSCVDIDGDGLSECRRNGESCDTNDDCTTPGEVCGYDPIAGALACQAQGPCNGPGDCATGFSCTDLWGDGVRECVPTGGSCTSSTTCDAGEVCAPPSSGGPPACVDGT